MADPTGTAIAAATPAHARAGRLRRFGGLGGRAALALALAVVVVASADHSHLRVDLSADRRFSIDPELARLLASQAEDVDVTGIWTAIDDANRYHGITDQVVRLTQGVPHLHWRRIDPELDRPDLERFAAEHGGLNSPGLYLSTTGAGQGRTYRIALSFSALVSLQREFGAGLVTLAEPTLPIVILLQGQGELHPGGGDSDGSDELSHALALAGCVAETREGAGGTIPANALLVIAGPTVKACGPEVVAAVTRHLQDGGRLLAFLDDRSPADLTAALRPFGILAGGFPACLATGSISGIAAASERSLAVPVVMSLNHNVKAHDVFPYANLVLGNESSPNIDRDLNDDMVYPHHPASEWVARSGIDVFSPRTAMVQGFDRAWLAERDAEQAKSDPDLPEHATWLLQTAPGDSWVQFFAKGLEVPKGLEHADAQPLACAVEYASRADSVQQGIHARAVVWGSRQAASNSGLAVAGYANADLVRSAVAWLTDRAQLTGIADLGLLRYQASISDRGVLLLFLGLVVLVPCCMLGMAMLSWWDRR